MLFKDENFGEDMVDILWNFYEWVLYVNENGEEIFEWVFVVGD